ncbi:unnamed protein product [Moneuplotes crassus]|uniref:Uncharacterized protein n=1 Tax=Euplotes crassus TaxID=5936 RepID=A0AAD1U7R2_EUPCR|nr:unnamed protein product [Moneuplotes crassus]
MWSELSLVIITALERTLSRKLPAGLIDQNQLGRKMPIIWFLRNISELDSTQNEARIESLNKMKSKKKKAKPLMRVSTVDVDIYPPDVLHSKEDYYGRRDLEYQYCYSKKPSLDLRKPYSYNLVAYRAPRTPEKAFQTTHGDSFESSILTNMHSQSRNNILIQDRGRDMKDKCISKTLYCIKCSNKLCEITSIDNLYYKNYKLIKKGVLAAIMTSLKSTDNISVKMSTLNKCIYDQNMKLRDKNSIFHPVCCIFCSFEIGKFYLTTNKKLKKYANKVCIIKSAVKIPVSKRCPKDRKEKSADVPDNTFASKGHKRVFSFSGEEERERTCHTLGNENNHSERIKRYQPKIESFRNYSVEDFNYLKNSRNSINHNFDVSQTSNSARRYQLRTSRKDSMANYGESRENASQHSLNTLKNSGGMSEASLKKMYFRFPPNSHADPSTFTSSLENPLRGAKSYQNIRLPNGPKKIFKKALRRDNLRRRVFPSCERETFDKDRQETTKLSMDDSDIFGTSQPSETSDDI